MRTLSPLEARGAGLLPGAKVLEVPDLATLLGKSKWTIYRWRCDDPERLPPSSIDVGGRVCWPVDALVGWQPPARASLRGRWPRGAKRAALAAIAAAARISANPDHE